MGKFYSNIFKKIFSAEGYMKDIEEVEHAFSAIRGSANRTGATQRAISKAVDLPLNIANKTAQKIALTGALGLGTGIVGAGIGIGVVAGSLAVGAGYMGIRGAAKLLGHSKGIAALGAGMVGVAGAGVVRTGIGAEFLARTALTGGIRGVQGPLDAWLPNFRNLPYTNIEKFALNSKLGPRLAMGAVGVGFVSALGSVITPKAPRATAYYDGVNMRRSGDLGAHAGYGKAVMNSANNFGNMDYKMAAQSLVHLL